MHKKKPYILVLTGPTASGKSACAQELGQIMPIEVINADMGQLYKPLSVGTAKPDLRTVQVPHHLYDVLDEPVDYTVVAYRQQVVHLVQQITARGCVPVIVGGSLFYIKSLIWAPRLQAGNLRYQGLRDCLWERLHAIDPERARAIAPNDTYRLERALAIWEATGCKPSQLAPVYDPIGCMDLVYLTRPRQELNERIEARVRQMLEQGWLAEVQALRGTPWVAYIKCKKIIGYSSVLEYLEQGAPPDSYEQLVSNIVRLTKAYAKRQDTAWRSLQKAVIAQHDPDLYLTEYLLTGDTPCGAALEWLQARIIHQVHQLTGYKK